MINKRLQDQESGLPNDMISLADEGLEEGLLLVPQHGRIPLAGGKSREELKHDAYPGLHDWIIDNLEYEEGNVIRSETLLVTTGREEALERICGALLNPGDVVLVETPASPLALSILIRKGAFVIQVACDAGGMLLGDLKQQLDRHRPKLVYITPDYSDTLGNVWSSVRRDELVGAVLQSGVWLVSDRSSGAAPFERRHTDALVPQRSLTTIAIDRGLSERLLEVGSLDGHGIQIGWIQASPAQIQRLSGGGEMDREAVRHGTLPGAAAELLLRPDFSWPQHAAALNREYALRRAEALAVLEGSRVLGAAFRRAAGSGRFLWGELPEGLGSAALLRAARLTGASFLPGAQCSAGAGAENTRTLRLSLAAQSRQRLRLGLTRLCEAAEEFTARWDG